MSAPAQPNLPNLVTVEEYLYASYETSREYVDGEVQERCVGERQHSATLGFFTYFFHCNAKAWRIRVLPTYHAHVAPTRFRVPDVTVLRADAPRENILRTPALLMVEILAPDDTFSRLRQKVDDYLRFGVEHIWVINPYDQIAYRADNRGFHEPAEGSATATLTIPGTPIAVPLPQLWRELD